MEPKQELVFLPFRLDLGNEQLWRGERNIPLRRKTFAVFRYLVEHPGQLVRKEELLDALWPDAYVSDIVLKVSMRELRRALEDDPKAPRFIETVHRRGYRFIGKVVSGQSSVYPPTPHLRSQLATENWQLVTSLVGREAELAQLHRWLEKALQGERQIAFITGEPGIGKTAVVEAFLSGISQRVSGNGEEANQKAKIKNQKAKIEDYSLAPNIQHLTPVPWIGRGQCVEHFGTGEAYLPVLSALGQLSRESGHGQLRQVLDQYAQMWLLQLPALLSPSERETLQRQTAGTTRARMLREIAEALEALTADTPLILTLEDLHWSDPSTLELLAFLARRRQSARLLILGTYRPVEMLGDGGQPLRTTIQELYAHKLSVELALGLLSETDVSTYLRACFPLSVLPDRLAAVLHQRTDGNPLFLVSMVEDLLTKGVIVEENGCWGLQGGVDVLDINIPENIRPLLTWQRDRLSFVKQQNLKASTVAGVLSSALAVAATLGKEIGEIEKTVSTLCNDSSSYGGQNSENDRRTRSRRVRYFSTRRINNRSMHG
jgi:DNA-binding winged helix-turn-helix (wHTH) protein